MTLASCMTESDVTMMNDASPYKGKKIIVVGLARSGTGAANLLACLGAEVTVTDSKPEASLRENIKNLLPAIKVAAGGIPEEVFDNADMAVVSPGVPLNIPVLIRAREKGVLMIGELELAYQIVRSKKSVGATLNGDPYREVRSQKSPCFIAVTGTNGKSTTSTLVDLMIKKAGFRSLLAGNIGNALTGEILKTVDSRQWAGGRGQEKDRRQRAGGSGQGKESSQESDVGARRAVPMGQSVSSKEAGFRGQGAGCLDVEYIVTEISSFQLEAIKEYRPNVAAVLNITPDHLDRYKDINDYIEAKARIFENQTPEDYLILNADDPVLMKMKSEKLEVRSKRPKVLYFSRKKEVDGIYLKDGIIFVNFPLPTSHFSLISVNEIKIQGAHNIENAMAASLAALISGCPVNAVVEVLRNFPGLEHRIEFTGETGGVKFINDSKGTNVGAVAKSLEGFENVILIMGGRDKGSDFSILREQISKKVKLLVLIGEAKDRISKAVGSITEVCEAGSMKDAVKLSYSKASPGDTVMLSPGCASFDMFSDYEDRGRKFKEAVKELIKEISG